MCLAAAAHETLTCQLQVYLPKDSLTSVAVSSPIAEVTVGPGFDVPILDVFSAFGTGNLNVFNATIVDLGISTSGRAHPHLAAASCLACQSCRCTRQCTCP